ATDMILRSFYEGGFSIHEDKIKMNHLFKPNINVARRFEKNIKLNAGKFNPLTYWENLKMISVWLGGSCGSQVTKLREKFPSIPLRDLGFHASEARMSLPFRDNTSEGILAIHNNFYEFIPKNDYENERYNCLQIDDLEVGKEYYILITNSSGLYRYDLGDVIQVTGFYKEAPIIKFMRKNKDMSDLVGEKLHINHFLFAREQLKLELILNDERFIIYPSQDYNGYELFCEISDIENKEKINVLSKKFDDFLQIANWEYETKRKSQRINPLRLINIPKGTINPIVYGKFQMGMRDSQYKWNYFTNEQPIIND
ncbi:MAG: GH3 auxin-responsive promoter family protein, partial [Nanoarchaeota archaeon]